MSGLSDPPGLTPTSGLTRGFALNQLSGIGGSFAAGYQFSFISRAASYVGSGTTAISSGTAQWLIEDRAIAGVNPGTVALTGNKKIQFRASNPAALTAFFCGNNQLYGQFPDLSKFTTLAYLSWWGNGFTDPFPDLSKCPSLLTIDAGVNPGYTGSVPSIAANPLFQIFQVGGCNLSGPIPSLTINTALTGYAVNNNNFINGNIPTFATNTLLTAFNAASNIITGVVPGFAVPAALKTIDLHNNLLTQAAVDAILAAVVLAGATGGTLNLGGTGNATPSAAGLADKATLITRTWTVTTN